MNAEALRVILEIIRVWGPGGALIAAGLLLYFLDFKVDVPQLKTAIRHASPILIIFGGLWYIGSLVIKLIDILARGWSCRKSFAMTSFAHGKWAQTLMQSSESMKVTSGLYKPRGGKPGLSAVRPYDDLQVFFSRINDLITTKNFIGTDPFAIVRLGNGDRTTQTYKLTFNLDVQPFEVQLSVESHAPYLTRRTLLRYLGRQIASIPGVDPATDRRSAAELDIYAEKKPAAEPEVQVAPTETSAEESRYEAHFVILEFQISYWLEALRLKGAPFHAGGVVWVSKATSALAIPGLTIPSLTIPTGELEQRQIDNLDEFLQALHFTAVGRMHAQGAADITLTAYSQWDEDDVDKRIINECVWLRFDLNTTPWQLRLCVNEETPPERRNALFNRLCREISRIPRVLIGFRIQPA